MNADGLFGLPGSKAPLDDLMVALFLLRLSADDLKREQTLEPSDESASCFRLEPFLLVSSVKEFFHTCARSSKYYWVKSNLPLLLLSGADGCTRDCSVLILKT